MANNPNVNKVVYGNQTVMDISDTTAEEGDVVSGKTFYKANGARSTGSAVIPDISNCYQTTDTAETTLDDADYFPFYDTSASGRRKTLWSNIKAKLKSYFDGIYTPTILLKDTVGWTGKNILALDNIFGGSNLATITNNGGSIRVHNDTAGTYKAFQVYVSVKPNTDYIVTSNAIYTSGKGRISIAKGDNSTTIENSDDFTADKNINFTFNSGTETMVIVKFWCTQATSDIGDINYNNTMIRDALITDSTFEPYHATVEDSKFNRSEQRVLGAKNLFNNTYTNTTINGVTFAKDANGIITANGTAINEIKYGRSLGVLPVGRYIVSGCAAGGDSSSKYHIRIGKDSSPTTWGTYVVVDTGEGAEFEVTEPNTYYSINLHIYNGYVANNLLFKPMLRLASDSDDTYVPYAMTNKELTDSKADKSSLATVATSGSYYDLVDEPQNESATSGQGAYTVSLCTRMEKYQWNQAFNNTVKRHTGSALAGATSVYIPIDFATDHIVSIGADNGHDQILKYKTIGIYGGGGLPVQVGLTFSALAYDTDFEVLTI